MWYTRAHPPFGAGRHSRWGYIFFIYTIRTVSHRAVGAKSENLHENPENSVSFQHSHREEGPPRAHHHPPWQRSTSQQSARAHCLKCIRIYVESANFRTSYPCKNACSFCRPCPRDIQKRRPARDSFGRFSPTAARSNILMHPWCMGHRPASPSKIFRKSVNHRFGVNFWAGYPIPPAIWRAAKTNPGEPRRESKNKSSFGGSPTWRPGSKV